MTCILICGKMSPDYQKRGLTMKKQKLIILPILIVCILFSCISPAVAALKGDIDGKAGVTAADARLVLRASVNLEVLTEQQLKLADVDGKPGITAADARLVLRASVNLENLGELEEVHVHEYNKVVSIEREPTCTGTGKQKVACSCGRETTQYTDKLGHDYQLTSEEAPTCKKQGKKISTCNRCGLTDTDYIPKIDHEYEITEEKPAGCETKGHIRYQCKYCTSVKADQFPATGHDYDSVTGLCKNCGNSDPNHYDEIPKGEKWIVDDNWEISIVSVKNHSLHSTSINNSQGYTNEQCVLITYKVKSIGYKPHLENATGLNITPLDFKVYDAEGEQAKNYVCNHTQYATVELEGLSATGVVPVVLMNNSDSITFVISEYDSDGVIRRAFFTADITD